MYDEFVTDWTEIRCAAGGQTGAAGLSSVPHPHWFIFVCVTETDTRPVSETFLSAEGLQDAYIDSQAYF